MWAVCHGMVIGASFLGHKADSSPRNLLTVCRFRRMIPRLAAFLDGVGQPGDMDSQHSFMLRGICFPRVAVIGGQGLIQMCPEFAVDGSELP